MRIAPKTYFQKILFKTNQIMTSDKYKTHLVHKRNALVSCFHEVVLRDDDDLARVVVHGQEEARHEQADEA